MSMDTSLGAALDAIEPFVETAVQPWSTVYAAAREWLVHGPALEAAEEVLWCERHDMHVRWDDALTCSKGAYSNDCDIVKRPLLPEIEEGK